MALEELHGVDWSALQDAYGDGTHVPELLRRASEQGAAGEGALRELADRLNHQGTPTPAAEAAMPFIVDLLSDEPAPQRAHLLLLAADLAAGGQHLAYLLGVHDGLPILRACLQAAGERLATLVADADANVRASALLAAAVAVEPDSALRGVLRERADVEKGELHKGLALIGLAAAARRAPEAGDDGQRWTKGLAGKGQSKTLAALAFVIAGVPLPELAETQLLAAIADRTKAVKGLPLGGGDLRAVAARALAVRGVRAERVADVSTLLEHAGKNLLATEVGLVLVDLQFGSNRVAEPRTAAELSPLQHALLQRLNRMPPAAFTNRGRLMAALERRGLPDLGPQLARFLGDSEPGPADDMVQGRPLWKWCRLTLDRVVARDEVLAVMKALTPEDALAVVVDLASAPYALNRRWPRPAVMTPEQEAEDESKLVDLAAECAAAASTPELMKQYADYQVGEGGPNRRGCAMITAALLRATGSIEPAYDLLLAHAMTISSYAPIVRSVLEKLPPQRVEALVLQAPYAVFVPRPKDGWLFADLAPTDKVARKLVTEMAGWGDRSNVPLEHAVTVLRAMGPTAHPAIDEALAAKPEHPKAEALRRVRGAG